MKILAIASIGGHWIQLLRLRPSFDGAEVVYVSTNGSCGSMVEGSKFISVTEASRWNKFKLIVCFFEVLTTIIKENPKVIITTGAAPGLMGVISGWVLRKRTIWVDSVANVEELSMSGKIATKFASRVYTQWEDLAIENKVYYSGNVLS